MRLKFIHDDFLLECPQSLALYHEYAAPLPIIDYHCHLAPEDIANNRSFRNLTGVWLRDDHYKWRAMRTAGVNERFITGDASDWEKFEQWARTVPLALRNPLYHWTHLELRRPFGISDRLLGPDTALEIWERCNALLATPEFSARGLLKQQNVEVICTTDDPVDDLRHHRTLATMGSNAALVLPTFRCDRAIDASSPVAFLAYTRQLSEASNIEIRTFADYTMALEKRHEYFHTFGCRLSDLAVETIPTASKTPVDLERSFQSLVQGNPLPDADCSAFQCAVMRELALMNHARGWVQQLHIGALRNNNSRMLGTIGANTGFDSIGDANVAKPLVQFLDGLDTKNALARTILYNINPRENELIACMIGNYQDGSIAGKIQYGSAWWFLDQMDGITRQLDALSSMSLLSQFVGMLTDSRSFVSYSRHEYFRRILCSMLGREMRDGLLPNDLPFVGRMVADICYYNAKRYFRFPERNST